MIGGETVSESKAHNCVNVKLVVDRDRVGPQVNILNEGTKSCK